MKKTFKRIGQAATNAKGAVVAGATVVAVSSANAAAIAAPDMTDAIGSVTAVFGAVLTVSVLIFGFKKVKSLL